MTTQTPAEYRYLAAILPYALGPDFSAETLHGHGIDFSVEEAGWGKVKNVVFKSTPLPLPSLFRSIFKEVCLTGTIYNALKNNDRMEFGVAVHLSWTLVNGGSNGALVGSFYFDAHTMELFAHRLESNKAETIFL